MSQERPLMADYHERFKDDPDYVMEGLYLDLMEQVSVYMYDRDITQAELARRMAVSEARVSQLFADSSNLTLKTIAKMLIALDAESSIRLISREQAQRARTPWRPTASRGSRVPEKVEAGSEWLTATAIERPESDESYVSALAA